MQTVQTRRNSSSDCIFFVQTVQTHRNSSSDLCIFLRANCAKTSKQLIWLCIFFVQTVQRRQNSSPGYKNVLCANCANSPPSHLTMYFLRANCANTSKQFMWLCIFFVQPVQTRQNSSRGYIFFSSCKLCKHIDTAHLTMYFLRAKCTNTSKQLIWPYILLHVNCADCCVSYLRANNRQRNRCWHVIINTTGARKNHCRSDRNWF